MFSPTSRLVRSGFVLNSSSHYSKLWRGSRASFVSSAPRHARKPPKPGRNDSADSPPKSAPAPRSTDLPSESISLNKISYRPETPQGIRKEKLARLLIESGHTLLYKAPSHVGFLAGTWVMAGMCFVGIYTMYLNEFWKPQPGFPWWVTGANRASMFVMSLLGGWIVLRGTRHITSIKLLPGQSVKMLVTIRRGVPLPFVPPKKIVTNPSDFILPSRMVAQLAIPSWANVETADMGGSLPSRVSRHISIALWTFFAGTRKIFTHEGFMDVTITDNNGLWKLDTAGKFDKGGESLLNIVSYEN